MNDLVTWLSSVLDLKQAHAEKDLWVLDRVTAAGVWTQHAGINLPYSEVWADGGILLRVHTPRHDADTTAIARFVKLARARSLETLADVDAKRRILELHTSEVGICSTCRGPESLEVEWDGEEETTYWAAPPVPWPCPTLRRLALPYAGQDGYLEAWRP